MMIHRDFRQFMGFLEEKGDLTRINREVDRKYEIGAGIRRSCDLSGPALLFQNVKGYLMQVLGAAYATRRRCIWGLGFTEQNVHQEFIKGVQKPIPPVTLAHSYCKDVVWIGDKIDLHNLPIPWMSPKDGGYFINSAVIFAKDPEYGRNISVHRCQVLDKNRLGLLAVPPQHLGVYCAKAEERGEPLEIALAIGVQPAVALSSQIKTSIGFDEVALAGGIQGEAIELAKCQTIEIEAPARAEIVIEGRIMPHVRGREGPFGEYTGYYGGPTVCPVIEVTAITMRENPIFQAVAMPHENAYMKQIPHESIMSQHIRKICPTVKSVHFPASSGCHENVIISIGQTRKGEAKNVIISALSAGMGVKNVIVVDEDINIFDPAKVDWALAYRVQPVDDVIILPKILSAGLDPSAKGGLTSGMGIDATKPFGVPFAEPIDIPEAEKFEIPGWPKIKAD